MTLSSFEVAMNTMASVVSDYLEEKKRVPKITKDGLNQLVKEQFPHCEKKEISRGAYEIRIPLAVLPRDPFSPTTEGTTLSCLELNVIIRTKKLKKEKRDDAASQNFMSFPDSDEDEDVDVDVDVDGEGAVNFEMFFRLIESLL